MESDTESAIEYDKKIHSGQAETDAEFQNFSQTKIQPMLAQLASSEDLMNQLRDPSSGYRKTGLLEGRWRGYTDKEAAALQFKVVQNLLDNLQITSLTPVTEKEIDLVKGLYAQLTNDPEANLGVLEQLQGVLRGKLRQFDEMDNFFQKNQTLRGYTPSAWSTYEGRGTAVPNTTNSTARVDQAMSKYLPAAPVEGF
jgi:hypothetical protein